VRFIEDLQHSTGIMNTEYILSSENIFNVFVPFSVVL